MIRFCQKLSYRVLAGHGPDNEDVNDCNFQNKLFWSFLYTYKMDYGLFSL